MNNRISSVVDIIRTHGVQRSDQVALIEGTNSQTWGQLYSRSMQVANGLRAAGVGSQDRVAFLDKNSIEHFEVFYGCALINAVAVDVNWRLAPSEVEFIVNDAQVQVFVVHSDFVSVVEAIRSNLTHVSTVLVINGDGQFTNYNDWVSSQSANDPGVVSKPDDVAFQLYSSGTTGRPKGVMLTNTNFLSLMPHAVDVWHFNADAINLAAMPLFHIGGGGWATAGQYTGCTTIVLREVNPAEVVRLIGAHKITHAFLVPAVIQFMLAVPDVASSNFSSLQLIMYGASPISEEVLVRAIETFGPIFGQAYGLTETTGSVTDLPPHDHDPIGSKKHLLRSCGKAIASVELRIVDTATALDMPVGEVGEIWCRSAQVMKGYWNDPAATAESIMPDGWFKSGDAGYMDADGYVYIHDRVKDMIVSGGENVYPAEVENILMAHPAVADAAVIGVPHERWGETAKAIIVKKQGIEVSEQELIAYCVERLAKFKCPTSVVWVDALPRNPTGKILKKDLRAPYWVGMERQVN
ncbi:MAG: long-chain-fatty-acid--CoA ligase [Ilumatobacteraceae bacterium]|nr:long-chain-fatty-acid--CoA ligase [Ilumatobacteraceae bacterium]